MSAVQGQSPRASADTTEHAADGSGQEPHTSSSGTDFGPNEWLVDELYQRYLADPSSVDMAWWNFFADYQPPAGSPVPPAKPMATATAPAPAAASAAPAAAPAPAEPTVAAEPRPAPEPAAVHDGTVTRLRGAAARTADNMAASLAVPTATSVRSIPAKLLSDNRIVINNHLARGRGGKVSFTHLIGFAMVRALRDVPVMNH